MSKSKFQIGDTVKCIEPAIMVAPHIEKEGIYTVKEILFRKYPGELIVLKEDAHKLEWHPERFEFVSHALPPPPSVSDNIELIRKLQQSIPS